MSCHLNSLFQNYFIIFILYSSIELIVNHLNFLANCPYFRKLYLSTVHFMSHSNSETYVLYIIVTFWKKCFAFISFNMYFVQTQCHSYCSHFQMYLPFDQFQKHFIVELLVSIYFISNYLQVFIQKTALKSYVHYNIYLCYCENISV